MYPKRNYFSFISIHYPQSKVSPRKNNTVADNVSCKFADLSLYSGRLAIGYCFRRAKTGLAKRLATGKVKSCKTRRRSYLAVLSL